MEPNLEEILPSKFYERDAHDLARDLLGKVLVRVCDEATCAGRIVEVEVYGGVDDPSCHADRGYPTERTAAMFGRPGTAYVYRIYGMYDCLNVVAPPGPEGKASAILVRALEPVTGLDVMAERRGIARPLTGKTSRALLSGPGKLCQALAIDRGFDGADLQSHPLVIVDAAPVPDAEIATSPRIGLNPATCGASTYFEWRYTVATSRFLSR